MLQFELFSVSEEGEPSLSEKERRGGVVFVFLILFFMDFVVRNDTTVSGEIRSSKASSRL